MFHKDSAARPAGPRGTMPIRNRARRNRFKAKLTARRRAVIAALLPTAVMMVSAAMSLSAKAAPRAVDPYTDGARTVTGRFDVFTQGANATGTRDSFTDGARAPQPADRSMS